MRYYETDFDTVLDLADAHPVKKRSAATFAIPDGSVSVRAPAIATGVA